MTADRGAPEGVSALIGRAVLTVAGVAFLRPGLSGLLRASASGIAWRGVARTPGAAPGVRVERGATGQVVSAEVEVVLHRSYRAVDVTRAVREAVRAAVREPSTPVPVTVRVTVTVTGIV
ncbi:Asp23/Gls24 family envelope stress response protein [Streptomyces sp. CA-243310]|uniref:Asp23/Gls24 family envelope stress response protein n=1 Tax=Streptomyces sp. CA-243310 TaxID=3240056 RepID=UPI003D8F474D